MAYNIEVKQMPARYLAVVKFRAGTSNMGQHMGEAFGAVSAYLASMGQHPAGPPLAQYEPAGDEFDTAAGFPVGAAVVGDGHVVPVEVPAGDFVETEHVGPYPKLGQAYEALQTWLKANGRETNGQLSYEQYLSDFSTPPAELRTIVSLPLKPR